MTLAQLKKGEKAVVEDLNTDLVPLKLIEMGCLPGNTIELLQLECLSKRLKSSKSNC